MPTLTLIGLLNALNRILAVLDPSIRKIEHVDQPDLSNPSQTYTVHLTPCSEDLICRARADSVHSLLNRLHQRENTLEPALPHLTVHPVRVETYQHPIGTSLYGVVVEIDIEYTDQFIYWGYVGVGGHTSYKPRFQRTTFGVQTSKAKILEDFLKAGGLDDSWTVTSVSSVPGVTERSGEVEVCVFPRNSGAATRPAVTNLILALDQRVPFSRKTATYMRHTLDPALSSVTYLRVTL